MKTQSVSFIVRANQNGTVEQIGRSSITHPKIVFKIISGNSRLFNTRDESVIFVKKKSEIPCF